jgi:hypothetical protein
MGMILSQSERFYNSKISRFRIMQLFFPREGNKSMKNRFTDSWDTFSTVILNYLNNFLSYN